LLKGDLKGALAGGERSIVEIMLTTHAGMTTDEFDKIVKDWIATARHPKTVVDMKNDWKTIFPSGKK
jgi:hypothetical protein